MKLEPEVPNVDTTAVIYLDHPGANMYGCLPCPRCGGEYRWPNRQLVVICDDCDLNEQGQRE